MYSPAEDSFFISEILSNYLQNQNKKIKILDMGSGSGVVSSCCLELGFKNITACDIGKEEIKYLNNKFKKQIKVIKSNLFSNIKSKFDLIVFNPPYLPEDKHDKKKDTTAGKKGNEIILKFLAEARNFLNKSGRIILLFSSFSQPEEILEKARELRYNYQLLEEKNLFFEKLFIYEFTYLKHHK